MDHQVTITSAPPHQLSSEEYVAPSKKLQHRVANARVLLSNDERDVAMKQLLSRGGAQGAGGLYDLCRELNVPMTAQRVGEIASELGCVDRYVNPHEMLAILQILKTDLMTRADQFNVAGDVIEAATELWSSSQTTGLSESLNRNASFATETMESGEIPAASPDIVPPEIIKHMCGTFDLEFEMETDMAPSDFTVLLDEKSTGTSPLSTSREDEETHQRLGVEQRSTRGTPRPPGTPMYSPVVTPATGFLGGTWSATHLGSSGTDPLGNTLNGTLTLPEPASHASTATQALELPPDAVKNRRSTFLEGKIEELKRQQTMVKAMLHKNKRKAMARAQVNAFETHRPTSLEQVVGRASHQTLSHSEAKDLGGIARRPDLYTSHGNENIYSQRLFPPKLARLQSSTSESHCQGIFRPRRVMQLRQQCRDAARQILASTL